MARARQAVMPEAGGLAGELRRVIASEGPLTVARYMRAALLHPEHGYYTQRDPLGWAGDFITAPEIHQMFGELIGLWCADAWQRLGAPPAVNLVELGPGRGTLAADALRAAAALPAFHSAIHLHLVEASPALRRIQEKTLAAVGAVWHATLDGVPDGPTIVVANEFFDALPIRQFIRGADGWRERLVDWNAAAGEFVFVLDTVVSPLNTMIGQRWPNAPPASVAEISPDGEAIAAWIGRRGAVALIIDYGHARFQLGDTLQAVKSHRRHEVLADPGGADLTAHVDFAALAAAAAATAAGAKAHGPVTQRDFLLRLGIAHRAQRLKASNPQASAAIDAALARLTEASAMGNLFRVLALAPPMNGRLAGFDE
jgi:NADH dehydrogenase [ubiquinone] 1 alpha subcomplex assembly factor 7